MSKSISSADATAAVNGLNYPLKVLVAWGEAIAGNEDIRLWLTKSDYPELGLFCHALSNQSSAREWLVKNGHPQLQALISGIEGREPALRWLLDHGFADLHQMALAADGDAKAMEELKATKPLLAVLAAKMEFVKDRIEENKHDFHRLYSS